MAPAASSTRDDVDVNLNVNVDLDAVADADGLVDSVSVYDHVYVNVQVHD